MSKAELLKQKIRLALEDKEITLNEVKDVIDHLLVIDEYAKTDLEEIIADGILDNTEQMQIRTIFQDLLDR
ncbi:MAG: hypothetical protein NE328_01970 [Lentisphaeraceae bacterium]|nr:hypothetical protein [Lentisphaeraceae bacterium]